MKKKLAHVKIYTDGACSGNPGPGGWAAILLFGDQRKEISGYEASTTNNRMELRAAIEGLKALNVPCQVDLYSDSAYLVSAFTQNWLTNWQNNGWKNAAGQPVSNIDLWQELLALAEIHTITWHKVKGHADNEYNNHCDKLAVEAIQEGRLARKNLINQGDLEEKIISHEVLHKGRIINLYRYNVKLSDDSLVSREIVHHSGGSVIIAINKDKEIYFVSQFRLAANRIMLELPAGKIDAGEDPLHCAKRELKEETGLEAKKWKKLSACYTSPGYSDEVLHIFLAEDLKQGKQKLDDGEFLNVTKLSLQDAMQKVIYGEIEDGKTCLGIFLAAQIINDKGLRK